MEELVMTLVCKTCLNQYGKWRPRCPACGEANPAVSVYVRPSDGATFTTPKRVKMKTPRTLPKAACVVCRKGGAKLECSSCKKLAHKGCLSLHLEDCREMAPVRTAFEEARKC